MGGGAQAQFVWFFSGFGMKFDKDSQESKMFFTPSLEMDMVFRRSVLFLFIYSGLEA